MVESLLKLKQTLTAMLDAHEQLLTLAKEKQTILIDGKVPELQSVISKESKYTELIRNLDNKREQHIQEFIKEQGLTKPSLTMDEVIQLIYDPEEKSLLSKFTVQLKNILKEISFQNHSNQQMIQMALSYIQYSMNILMPKEPAIGYGMKNQVRSVKFLDAKA